MAQVKGHEEGRYDIEHDPAGLAEHLELRSRQIPDWVRADGLVPAPSSNCLTCTITNSAIARHDQIIVDDTGTLQRLVWRANVFFS